MEDTITLGKNIELNGMKELNGGDLVILKKILGNYTKDIGNKYKDFEKLVVKFSKDSNFKIECIIKVKSKEFKSKASGSNLFFTMNEALEKLNKEIK